MDLFLVRSHGLERCTGMPAKPVTPASVFLLLVGFLGGVELGACSNGACTGTNSGVVGVAGTKTGVAGSSESLKG
jgi:hypothetical protein